MHLIEHTQRCGRRGSRLFCIWSLYCWCCHCCKASTSGVPAVAACKSNYGSRKERRCGNDNEYHIGSELYFMTAIFRHENGFLEDPLRLYHKKSPVIAVVDKDLINRKIPFIYIEPCPRLK